MNNTNKEEIEYDISEDDYIEENDIKNVSQDVRKIEITENDDQKDQSEDTIKLNEDQLAIYNDIISNKVNHVFISGTAGTGKSRLLKALLKTLHKHYKIKCCVVAASAIAARNVEGKTIHSIFNFDFNGNYPKRKVVEIKKNNRTSIKITGKMYFPFEILIIDEISMVSDIMFDKIDECLRHHCDSDYNSELPFAGKRVICFGDLFQLEPIKNNDSTLAQNKPVFFAKSWSHLEYRELTKNMRQSEKEFIRNLNLLREGDTNVLKYFNKFIRDITTENRCNSLTLFSTNHDAKLCNEYLFSIVSDDKEIKNIKIECIEIKVNDEEYGFVYPKNSLTTMFHETMNLCRGTRIMFTKNHKNYLNGEMGVIIDFSEKKLTVKKDNGLIIEIEKEIVLFNKSENSNKKTKTN